MKRIILVLVALVMITTTLTATAETKVNSYNAQVSADTVVYATPWDDAKNLALGVITPEVLITIIAETDDWYAIVFDGGTGFIRKTLWTSQQSAIHEAVISGGKVWLRYEPSKESKKDKVIYAGEIIEVSGDIVYNEEEDVYYYPIRYQAFDGIYVTRYVTAQYVEFTVE